MIRSFVGAEAGGDMLPRAEPACEVVYVRASETAKLIDARASLARARCAGQEDNRG